jgi:tetratricopeptide (TPR) repeat protein
MPQKPVIFVSAVNRELNSAREVVARALENLGYIAARLEFFSSESGDLAAAIRRQIDSSIGVIQLVGQCFGSTLLLSESHAGAMSYVEYEAAYARQQGKEVWYFLLDETFPADSLVPEPPDRQELQRNYRERIKSSSQLYHLVRNFTELEAKVLSLRVGVEKLSEDVAQEREKKALEEAARTKDRPANLKELTVSEFVQLHFKDRFPFPEKARPFCFILGAGASVQSGIPAAGALVEEWLRDLQRAAESRDDLETWATFENLKIVDFSFDRRAEFYSQVYDKRYSEREEDGARFLESKMDGKPPSYGYAVLAQLLGGAHRVVITTNFDNLVSDAIFQFGGQAPFVCGHESLAGYIPSRPGRPVIIKLHRDVLMGPISSVPGVSSMAEGWRTPVTQILQTSTPIFIGYGGNDGSLMTFLKQLPEGVPDRVYWCQYKNDPVNQEVADYLRHKNRYLIRDDGFDQFMSKLHGALKLPDLSEELKKANEHRLAALSASLHRLTTTYDQQLHSETKEKGPSAAETLETRLLLARSFFDRGRLLEAAQEYRSIVALGEQALGAEHPTTLQARNWLGNTLVGQGRYNEGEKEHRAVLAIRERMLGAEHPDTLKSRNNLAVALRGQGKHAEVEQEHRAVLAIQERLLGAEHHDTLVSRSNLANALQDQSKYAEAEREHRAVLAIWERVMGAEHRATLAGRNNLANSLRYQGKLAEAEGEYRAMLAISERVLGAEHPNTLMGRYNLATTLQDQNKHAEAEREHRAVLAIRERVLGAEHPEALQSRNNLAGALLVQGKYVEAETELRAILAIRERVLGAEHPDTLANRNNLALALQDQGKHAEAEREHRAVLPIRERVLGAEHPDVFRTCHNLALCLAEQGKLTEALEFSRRAYEGMKKVLGKEHSDTKNARDTWERIERDSTKEGGGE